MNNGPTLIAAACRGGRSEVRVRMDAARRLRAQLPPTMLQKDVAAIIAKEEGRPFTRQAVELVELGALSKLLLGLRKEMKELES